MPRIAGIEVSQDKPLKLALTQIYGVGRATAQKIAAESNVNGDTLTGKLTDNEISRISNVIESSYKVEGELKQIVFRDIKRLKDIRAYRGVRHKVGLPTRGQNTRSNAVTRKGKNIAVGGLNRKLDKK